MLSHAAPPDARAPASDDFDFAALRRREFARLDEHGHGYLDYTGSALHGVSQLRAHMRLLESGLFGNPHSESDTARASTQLIDAARARVLRFLDVDASTHVVCFTANCSAAIKLVAESYPFGARSNLVLAVDNHNSINGMREYARAAGGAVRPLPIDEALELDQPLHHLQQAARAGAGLLAYPAQSNFSGVRHPLALVRQARALGFEVMLDCAAYLPSHPLSLRECPADFAVMSFYKLFGYPTGVGALVMRREALGKLRRPWFAGGTVRYASVSSSMHRLHEGAEGFEDGTADFLGVAALPAGFDLLEQVGMARLQRRVAALTADMLTRLARLRHGNGAPRVRVYGPASMDARGGALCFNLLDAEGRTVPYATVEAAARAARLSVRGGCFCNPGAAEVAFGIAPDRLAACLRTLADDFTPQRLADCSGSPVGAIRASVGLANSHGDLDRLLGLIETMPGGRTPAR